MEEKMMQLRVTDSEHSKPSLAYIKIGRDSNCNMNFFSLDSASNRVSQKSFGYLYTNTQVESSSLSRT